MQYSNIGTLPGAVLNGIRNFCFWIWVSVKYRQIGVASQVSSSRLICLYIFEDEKDWDKFTICHIFYCPPILTNLTFLANGGMLYFFKKFDMLAVVREFEFDLIQRLIAIWTKEENLSPPPNLNRCLVWCATNALSWLCNISLERRTPNWVVDSKNLNLNLNLNFWIFIAVI